MSFNRPKINNLERRRNKQKQMHEGHTLATIDNKKARQHKLWEKKMKRKEEKRKAKDAKMQIE